MADRYIPESVPSTYDAAFLERELQRISNFLEDMEAPLFVLTPVHVEPVKKREGMVVNADGTNWNPGGGAGLYQRLAGAWVKL